MKEMEQIFLKDVSTHKMQILRDDGTYRHIKFSREKSYAYSFTLITWPGHLCISGDMGTYVFARIHDMFDFFIMDKNNFNYSKEKKLSINSGYWSEKVISIDKTSGIKEYSEELFQANIKEYFDTYWEEPEDCKTEKEKCWEKIKENVLFYSDNEQTAYDAACNFEYNDFQFTDFWERSSQEYTYHYIWNLYAIVWGILTYKGGAIE